MSLALRIAGFRVAAAVEIDSNAAQSYARNHSDTLLFNSDINSLAPQRVLADLGLSKGEIDLLSGCPPCQGFTRLRNSSGKGDGRNGLLSTYLTWVREIAPRAIIFENVPGLAKLSHGRWHLGRLRAGLVQLGYSLAEGILDAADFGTAQHRKRLVLIGVRKNPASLPKPTHRGSDGRNRHRTVRDAIGRLPRATHDNADDLHVPAKTGEKVKAFLRLVPRDGGSRKDVQKSRWLACHRDHDGHSDVYGRLSWDLPSVTITSGCTNPSKGRFTHPTEDRPLTLREASLLQGFPAGYQFQKRDAARQIGNAVPIPLGAALARQARRLISSDGP